MENSQTTGKKWYQKPENVTSALFLAGIGFVAYNYGMALLSGILGFAGFLGVAAFLTVVVGSLIALRQPLTALWKVAMYKITNAIYKIDPIAIAFSKLDSLKERAERINQAIEKISGALKNVNSQIAQNNKEITQKTEELKFISKQERPNEMQQKLVGNAILRLQNWNQNLLPLRETMTNMSVGIRKLYDAANFVIKDKEDALNMLQKQYESVKIGWAAVREAQNIYGKNSEDRELLEQMIGLAGEDMNNKIAEMDRFMELATPVFTQLDIQNGMQDAKVQEMINKITGGELDKVIELIEKPMSLEPKQLTPASTSKNVLPKGKEAVKIPAHTSSGTDSSSGYDVLN